MKISNIAAVLLCGLFTHAVSAQTPASPPPDAPAAPAPTPVPSQAPSASTVNVAEGTLFKTQRSKNDKGKYEWVCTYSVANLKRSVLLDESCPSTMVFELKR